MFSNWLTWKKVSTTLDAFLRDARIEAVFTQQKNELLIELSGTSEPAHLQISVQPHFTWILPKVELSRAKKNSMDLFPAIPGERISSVDIAQNERILRVSLKSGNTVYVSLLPSRGNVFLYDDQRNCIDQFKRKSIPIDPISLCFDESDCFPANEEVLQHYVKNKDLPPTQVLKALRPWLRGTLASELLFRSGLPTDDDSSSPGETDVQRISTAFSEIAEEYHSAHSYIYSIEDDSNIFSLMELRFLKGKQYQHYKDVTEGMQKFVRHRWYAEGIIATRERVKRITKQEIEKTERKLSLLPSETELKKRVEQWRKFGNLLMIHLMDTPSQPDRMLVPDIFTDPRLIVSIPLQPSDSVLENAQMYFVRAQHSEASLDYVKARRIRLLDMQQQLAELLAECALITAPSELRETLAKHNNLLRRLSLTEKGTRDTNPFPFRRFLVAGGFEVWAGRSSANNDLLTVRHSRPNDIWFHARGVGGSHVVLKTGSAAGEPARDAIRQAAAIAAYYSKHRKAKQVPVAYTEKKYVRKPKGSAPGSVVMEREKVIMVRPELPEGMSEE